MRTLNKLTEKEVKNAQPDDGKFVTRLHDGCGLYLQVTKSKVGGLNRNWIFRFELDGVRHDMGLGPLHTVGLAAARQRAKELREQLVRDVDPFEARKQAKAERKEKAQAACAEKAKATTFRECADKYIELHGDKWGNAKHAKQWLNSLEQHVFPIIGDLNVADIDEAHLLKVLQPIWKTTNETARRVRARIEAVLGLAIVSKYRSGDNPARWKNHLQTLLGGAAKTIEHHPALSIDEAPGFIGELREKPTAAARALEFLIHTAARTGEVIGCTWEEIDLKAKVWTVPAGRMKSGREHRVPLSDRAVELLKAQPRRGAHVFGSAVTGGALAHSAMLDLVGTMRPGLTVHGFRSTFKDWATERANFPDAVVEKALAHAVSDKTERAYRRGDLFEKRRRLMEVWAGFLAKPLPAVTGAAVIYIGASARDRRL